MQAKHVLASCCDLDEQNQQKPISRQNCASREMVLSWHVLLCCLIHSALACDARRRSKLKATTGQLLHPNGTCSDEGAPALAWVGVGAGIVAGFCAVFLTVVYLTDRADEKKYAAAAKVRAAEEASARARLRI